MAMCYELSPDTQLPVPEWPRKPIDQDMARALTEAGYMPLCEYVRLFGTPWPEALRGGAE